MQPRNFDKRNGCSLTLINNRDQFSRSTRAGFDPPQIPSRKIDLRKYFRFLDAFKETHGCRAILE
jgi:hypothetical protein